MAIFECPECKNSVSDKASFCPSFGFPLEKQKLYRIWLSYADSENRELVKLIQDIRGIDFIEAQNLLQQTPFTLINDISKDVANKYCNDIINLGAVAEVLEQSENINSNKKYYSLKVLSGDILNRELVKFISEIRGTSFVEARDLLEKAPFIVANNMGIEIAKNYCDRIINLGGIAEIIEQEEYDSSLNLSLKGSTNTNSQTSMSSFWQIVLAILIAVILIAFE